MRQKLTRPRKLFGPWTTIWSKQYLSTVHSVTCSLLWVRCLFDLISISDFGGKWPLKWKFSKVSPDSSTGHRTMFHDQILWKSAVVKLPKGRVVYHTKKTCAPRDSSQPPFWQKSADRALNYLHVVIPWQVHVIYWIWSGSAAFCRNYSGKIDFSAQKVITIYRLSAYNDWATVC